MRFAHLMQLRPSFPSSGELCSTDAWTAPDAGRNVYGRASQVDADTALIARIALGDRHAFSDLVVRHGDRARLLSQRILGHHDIAEMLVEDVFAELWRTGGRCVGPDDSLWTWLCRAVVTRCRPRDGIVTARPAAEEPHAEPSCYSGAALDRAMTCLDATERTVIILAYHEGASLGQIASAMQLTGPEIERLLTSARRSLLASLAPTPTLSAVTLADRKIAKPA